MLSKRVLTAVIAALGLIVPVAASADPITAFSLFAGSRITLGPQNNVAGMIGSNGAVTANPPSAGVDNNSNVHTIKSGGTVTLQNQVTVTGNIVANGNVSIGNNDTVTGNVSVATGRTITLGSNTTVGSQTIGGTPYTTTVIPPPTPGIVSDLDPVVNIADNSLLSLAPDTRNDLVAGNQSILQLSAGTYYFDTWTFGNNGILRLPSSGNVTLYFTGNITLGSGFQIQGFNGAALTVADAGRLYTETLGNFRISNGAANTGKLSWLGTLVASGLNANTQNLPNAVGTGSDIFFGSETTLIGTAWARRNLITDQYFTQIEPPSSRSGEAVPEPASLVLLGTGLIALASLRRARR